MTFKKSFTKTDTYHCSCNLKNNLEKASHTTLLYEKILLVDLSCNSLNLWNCMERVYDWHFSTVENCMISIFGQPGSMCECACVCVEGEWVRVQ